MDGKPLFSVRPSGVAELAAVHIPDVRRLWKWLHVGTSDTSHHWFGIRPHLVSARLMRDRLQEGYPEFIQLTSLWPADAEIECWSIDSDNPDKVMSIYVMGSAFFPEAPGCVSVPRSLDAYYLSYLLTLDKEGNREFRAVYPVTVTKGVIPRT